MSYIQSLRDEVQLLAFRVLRRKYQRAPSSQVLYVHIGPYKTGSTSLQSFFREIHPYLQDIDFSYPTFFDEKSQSALDAATMFELYGPQGLVHFLNKLANNFPEQTKSLISCEYLCNVTELGGHQLFRAFAKTRILVFCFFRHQTQLIESHYLELLKQGVVSKNFRDYVVDFLERKAQHQPEIFDYFQLWKNWKNLGEFKILPLNRNTPEGLADYFAFAGEIPMSGRFNYLNSRLSWRIVDALRSLNAILSTVESLSAERIGQISYEVAKELESLLDREDTPVSLFDEDSYKLVVSHYANSNRKINRFFPGLSTQVPIPYKDNIRVLDISTQHFLRRVALNKMLDHIEYSTDKV